MDDFIPLDEVDPTTLLEEDKISVLFDDFFSSFSSFLMEPSFIMPPAPHEQNADFDSGPFQFEGILSTPTLPPATSQNVAPTPQPAAEFSLQPTVPIPEANTVSTLEPDVISFPFSPGSLTGSTVTPTHPSTTTLRPTCSQSKSKPVAVPLPSTQSRTESSQFLPVAVPVTSTFPPRTECSQSVPVTVPVQKTAPFSCKTESFQSMPVQKTAPFTYKTESFQSVVVAVPVQKTAPFNYKTESFQSVAVPVPVYPKVTTVPSDPRKKTPLHSKAAAPSDPKKMALDPKVAAAVPSDPRKKTPLHPKKMPLNTSAAAAPSNSKMMPLHSKAAAALSDSKNMPLHPKIVATPSNSRKKSMSAFSQPLTKKRKHIEMENISKKIASSLPPKTTVSTVQKKLKQLPQKTAPVDVTCGPLKNEIISMKTMLKTPIKKNETKTFPLKKREIPKLAFLNVKRITNFTIPKMFKEEEPKQSALPEQQQQSEPVQKTVAVPVQPIKTIVSCPAFREQKSTLSHLKRTIIPLQRLSFCPKFTKVPPDTRNKSTLYPKVSTAVPPDFEPELPDHPKVAPSDPRQTLQIKKLKSVVVVPPPKVIVQKTHMRVKGELFPLNRSPKKIVLVKDTVKTPLPEKKKHISGKNCVPSPSNSIVKKLNNDNKKTQKCSPPENIMDFADSDTLILKIDDWDLDDNLLDEEL